MYFLCTTNLITTNQYFFYHQRDAVLQTNFNTSQKNQALFFALGGKLKEKKIGQIR